MIHYCFSLPVCRSDWENTTPKPGYILFEVSMSCWFVFILKHIAQMWYTLAVYYFKASEAQKASYNKYFCSILKTKKENNCDTQITLYIYIYIMTNKLLTPKENIICNIILETIKKKPSYALTLFSYYFNPFFNFNFFGKHLKVQGYQMISFH